MKNNFNFNRKQSGVMVGALIILAVSVLSILVVTNQWSHLFSKSTNFTDALAADGNLYPLKVSDNGRYLVTSNNSPFFIFADTGWMIFSSLTNSDIEYYLDDRHKKEVNTILCYIAPWDIDRTNKAGQKAFNNNDLSTPNDAYFSHVDWVINQAAARNMQMIINPAALANYTNHLTPSSARALGRYVGKRYKNFPNIIWFMGGDIAPDKVQQVLIREMAAGILENDTNHLITMHPRGQQTSSTFFHNDRWLDFNMYQTYQRGTADSYLLGVNDFNLTPIKPTINIEPNYEKERDTTAYHIRQSAGWSFFSGTMGMSYGAAWIWMFDYRDDPWKDNMDLPGLNHLQNMVNAITSRAWSSLVPDLDHTLLTSGSRTFGGYEYATAARASDGSFAMMYLPNARPITIDMSQFNGSKTAKWFDPTNDTYTVAGTYSNTGSQDFAAQPANSAGEYDWILIIE